MWLELDPLVSPFPWGHAFWTGCEVLFYGGLGYGLWGPWERRVSEDAASLRGARFDRDNGTWSMIPEYEHFSEGSLTVAAWTGSELIALSSDGHGAAYSLEDRSWRSLSMDGAPYRLGRAHECPKDQALGQRRPI